MKFDLNSYCTELGISGRTKQLLEAAVRNAPVRKVQSGVGNVRAEYPGSLKNPPLSLESRSLELAAAIRYAFDQDVLFFVAQPVRIDCPKERTYAFPDFLVFRRSHWELADWHPENRLQRKAEKYPSRFTKDENGQWHDRLLEREVEALGGVHRLSSESEVPPIFISNIDFLSDYLMEACPTPTPALLDKVRAVVNMHGWIRAGDLYAAAPEVEPDTLLYALARGIVTFDWESTPVSDVPAVLIFRDDVLCKLYLQELEAARRSELAGYVLQEGVEVVLDGIPHVITLEGADTYMLQRTDSEGAPGTGSPLVLEKSALEKLVLLPSTVVRPLDAPPANHAAQRLLGFDAAQIEREAKRVELASGPLAAALAEGVSRATYFRIRRTLQDEAGSIAGAIAARLEAQSQKGNRIPRIPAPVLPIIATIASRINHPSSPSLSNGWTLFKDACQKAAVEPCSRKAFVRRVSALLSARVRHGARFDYQHSAHPFRLHHGEPIHGVRPWQYVHIDHTELELVLKSRRSRKLLKRVWLTLAIDASTRRVLGFFLSFHPPSFRSCMMVIRAIVKKYGRLPVHFVVDNGKEFHSAAFRMLARAYDIRILYRPPHQARFGAVIERLFGTTQHDLIHALPGNTKVLRNVRQVTKSVNPNNLAEWDIWMLHVALETYFEEVYGESPQVASRDVV